METEKMKYKWNLTADTESRASIPLFFKAHHIPDGLARILMRRNIVDEETLSHFLYDDLDNLFDPFLMRGMDQAVNRIIEAIRHQEKIVIYGDYDVDGITASLCGI